MSAAVLAEHGTSVVGDALDMVGLDGGLPGIARRSGSGCVAGPAFTVGFEPVPPGAPAPAADYIDEVPAGAVVVLANSGTSTCTVWGDLLTRVALARGVAGTVIDGAHRDLDAVRELQYPLWSAATYMKSGKNRARMCSTGVPVDVAGVRVHPGDLVCADGSGVVVVPGERAAEVVARVLEVAEIERRILLDLAHGVPLRDARARHRYHAAALRTAR